MLYNTRTEVRIWLKIIKGLTLAEGELLIIAVRTPKAWTVILSDPLSQTYVKIRSYSWLWHCGTKNVHHHELTPKTHKKRWPCQRHKTKKKTSKFWGNFSPNEQMRDLSVKCKRKYSTFLFFSPHHSYWSRLGQSKWTAVPVSKQSPLC